VPLPLPTLAGDTSDLPIPPAQHESVAENTLDMAIGTLVHRYLEAIALDGLETWHDERIHNLLPHFERTFRMEGHDLASSQTAAREVQAAILGAINSDSGRWILGPREAADCEVPMSSLHPDTPDAFSHHVIDRTFTDAGTRWIIDYKTLRTIDQGTVSERVLQDKAKSYQPQLERYAALFEAEGLPVRTAIFFPAHGTLVKI
jgi:ATP-dependent exoDNAse (exonuclease V) beta subunit